MEKAKVLQTWCAYAEERANFLEAGTTVYRAFRNARIGAGLRKWQEFAWQRKSAIALISRIVNGKLYAGFATWAEVTTAQISDEVREYVSWKSGGVVDSDLHHTFSDTIETNRFADLIYVGKKIIRQLPERFVAVRFAYVIYPRTADKRVIFICRGM